jgi:predicted nuclease with TOPRIM domain
MPPASATSAVLLPVDLKKHPKGVPRRGEEETMPERSGVPPRLDRIEQTLEAHDRRLERIETRLADHLDHHDRLDARIDRLESRVDRVPLKPRGSGRDGRPPSPRPKPTAL